MLPSRAGWHEWLTISWLYGLAEEVALLRVPEVDREENL